VVVAIVAVCTGTSAPVASKNVAWRSFCPAEPGSRYTWTVRPASRWTVEIVGAPGLATTSTVWGATRDGRAIGTSTAGPPRGVTTASTCQIPSCEMLPPDAANVPLPLAPLGTRSSVDGPRPDVEARVKRRVRPSATTGSPVSKSVTTAVKRLKPAVPGSTASRTLTVVPKSLPVAMSGDAGTGGGPLAADAGGATL